MATKTVIDVNRKIELLGEDHPKVHRARQLADQRYGQALWYAFGAVDLRPDLRDLVQSVKGRENDFAQQHKDHALTFHLDLIHFLPSVQDAFCKWIESIQSDEIPSK